MGRKGYAGCRVEDADGNVVLKPDPDGFVDLDKSKGYVDADGNEVLIFDAQQYVNLTGGDYGLVPPEGDDPEMMLSENFSLTTASWTVSDADGDEIATATSQSVLFRYLGNLPFGKLLFPKEYVIEAADGTQVGTISTEWADSSPTVEISDDAPAKPALLLLGMAIMKLEKD